MTALVQSSPLFQHTASSLPAEFTMDSNFTAGNSAVFTCSHWHDADPIGRVASVTLGGTAATRIARLTSSEISADIWYATNITGGVNTVNVTWDDSSSFNYLSGGCDEWTPFSDVDTPTLNTATGSSTTPSVSTSAATAESVEVCYGMLMNATAGSSPTLTLDTSGGWVLSWENENNTDHIAGSGAYFETSSTGTQTVNWTVGSSISWGAAIVAFKLAAGQTAAPTSDITSGWTPSTGATLYGTIDEASPGTDTDYDYTGSAATMEVKFASLTDPSTYGSHQVKYRIASASTGTLTVSLRQGSSQIASWSHSPPPSAITTYTGTLTSAEAESITDYTDLRLRVVSST